MDGDVIRRIGQHRELIGHVHMAGTPGRNEMGPHQEINYPAVLAALLKAGYQGYCAHEWLPTRDTEQSLTEMIRLCDI
jgi:hydroxypyruvate isomerase